MREKELELVEITSTTDLSKNPEELRFQELHENIMNEEANRYFVLGQIKAYIDIIKEDLQSVIQKVDNLREDIREYRNIAAGDSKFTQEDDSE